MSAGTTFETSTNSYQIGDVLGEGGSGTVYRVSDGSTAYALKLLNPDKATRDKLKRFENELQFCSRNAHKNIITVKDHGSTVVGEKKAPFYVMPLYGDTLRKLMDRGIPGENLLPYFAQVLDGVEAAHLKGVWHRDLKPENILFEPSTETLVVADWGVAHFGEDELYTLVETRPHDRLANFQYAAPEQRMRGRAVDQRADIFALGLILNEMFTGELLQGTGHKTIASVAPDFAPLDDLVNLMVRQSVMERPDSIATIKNEFREKGNEMISLQKISELTKAVVPASEIDDPLITNPVRVVDVDYQGDSLLFKLHPIVNAKWIDCFRNIGTYQSIPGKGPPHFGWIRGTAIIQATEAQSPKIAEYFKRYVEAANVAYAERVKNEQRQKEAQERTELRRQLEAEQRRQRVRQNIRI